MNIHTLVNWEKTSETLQIVLPGELEKVMSFGFVGSSGPLTKYSIFFFLCFAGTAIYFSIELAAFSLFRGGGEVKRYKKLMTPGN